MLEKCSSLIAIVAAESYENLHSFYCVEVCVVLEKCYNYVVTAEFY